MDDATRARMLAMKRERDAMAEQERQATVERQEEPPEAPEVEDETTPTEPEPNEPDDGEDPYEDAKPVRKASSIILTVVGILLGLAALAALLLLVVFPTLFPHKPEPVRTVISTNQTASDDETETAVNDTVVLSRNETEAPQSKAGRTIDGTVSFSDVRVALEPKENESSDKPATKAHLHIDATVTNELTEDDVSTLELPILIVSGNTILDDKGFVVSGNSIKPGKTGEVTYDADLDIAESTIAFKPCTNIRPNDITGQNDYYDIRVKGLDEATETINTLMGKLIKKQEKKAKEAEAAANNETNTDSDEPTDEESEDASTADASYDESEDALQEV